MAGEGVTSQGCRVDLNGRVALVTGASAGLGTEFARLFARDGHDVILVARSEGPLRKLAEELTAAHRARCEVIAADLADPASCGRVHAEVQRRGLQVDFLVNNAGFGSSGAFLDQDLTSEVGMVEVNVAALLRLCHLFGREMRARGHGRILNIASSAGFQPGPYMATYFATKAFVVMFSQALSYELKDSGVTVTCHCPGATATSFAQRAGNQNSKLFQRPGVATAADVAAHAYSAMLRGEALSIHGLPNQIGVFLSRLAPRSLAASIAASLNKS